MCERLVITASSEQGITRSYLDRDNPPVPNDLTPPPHTGPGHHLYEAGAHVRERVVIEKNRVEPRCWGGNVRATPSRVRTSGLSWGTRCEQQPRALAHTQTLIITEKGSGFHGRLGFLPGRHQLHSLCPEKTRGKSDFTPCCWKGQDLSANVNRACMSSAWSGP